MERINYDFSRQIVCFKQILLSTYQLCYWIIAIILCKNKQSHHVGWGVLNSHHLFEQFEPLIKYVMRNDADPRSQLIQNLQNSIAMCQYSCVVLELERTLKHTLGNIEKKLFLQKTHGFCLIKIQSQARIYNEVRQTVQKKLKYVINLLEIKRANHCASGFFMICQYSRKQRKIHKYELSMKQLMEIDDPNTIQQKKQLQRLSLKYNRLMAQFSILTSQAKEIGNFRNKL